MIIHIMYYSKQESPSSKGFWYILFSIASKFNKKKGLHNHLLLHNYLTITTQDSQQQLQKQQEQERTTRNF